jgi:hypothetical protein
MNKREDFLISEDHYLGIPFRNGKLPPTVDAVGDFDGSVMGGQGIFFGDTEWEYVQEGTNSNALNVGDSKVKIDGANGRIIVNDGSDNRVLIGYGSGLF